MLTIKTFILWLNILDYFSYKLNFIFKIYKIVYKQALHCAYIALKLLNISKIIHLWYVGKTFNQILVFVLVATRWFKHEQDWHILPNGIYCDNEIKI